MHLLWLGSLLGVAALCIMGLRINQHSRRWVERRMRGLCTRCGYDLTNNKSGICPECGKPTGAL